MTTDQQNRKDVIDNVCSHFDNHEPVWSAIGPVSESVAALKSTRQEIALSALVQADGSSAGTTAKNMALELCADKTYLITRRVCAWARKNGRADIVEAVDFSESDLKYGAEDDRIRRFELVIRYATENKTELAAYKVNDAAIDDLQTAVNTVNALKGKRSDKVNHRIFSTANIEAQFTKSVRIFETLDDEVEGLIENPEFIETYFIARRKTDRKATRTKAGTEPEAAGN
ncbi:MAG: hypothetical protein EOO16_16005 [Chitinophagaceae bacterium]|nr:MAG: hypothetical protein EOO16_16005 [Chitinophagaceae bacterium]